jgi:hypothetical protein
MNVEKRTAILNGIVAKTKANAKRADGVAKELLSSFGGVRTMEARKARDLARKAKKLAGVLSRAISSIRF